MISTHLAGSETQSMIGHETMVSDWTRVVCIMKKRMGRRDHYSA